MGLFAAMQFGFLLESAFGWGMELPQVRSLTKLRVNLYRRTPLLRFFFIHIAHRWSPKKARMYCYCSKVAC